MNSVPERDLGEQRSYDASLPEDQGQAGLQLRLGTRGSNLARWQAQWVADRLRQLGVDVQLIVIATEGDLSARSLGEIGGQGVFTKEIQRALLDGRIDLAVHSLKDLPTEPVEGLALAAIPPRESNHDVLVCHQVAHLDALPAGSRVGTGSIRRQSQLLFHRPDLVVSDIRGNVETRLRKLAEGQFDALVLAEAGLRRLGLEQHITWVFPRLWMLPAVGQGALGIEVRGDDDDARRAVARLNHCETWAAVVAERSMLSALRAGCLAPVGAWSRIEDGVLRLDGVVLTPVGSRRLAVCVSGPASEPTELGIEAARRLTADGAGDLIDQTRGRTHLS
jgi:hydroxymethylbilane synthase